MYAVGNHFNRHVFLCKDALNGTRHFEFPVFVDYGHSVVKMRGMRHAGFVGRMDILVSGACMSDGRQYTVFAAAFDKVDGAG